MKRPLDLDVLKANSFASLGHVRKEYVRQKADINTESLKVYHEKNPQMMPYKTLFLKDFV